MVCFGILSVYNFIRDNELHSRFGELETRREGGRDIILENIVNIL